MLRDSVLSTRLGRATPALVFSLGLALAATALATSSCVSDDSTEDTSTTTTSVVVDPAEFLGSLPCGDVEGAPKSYSAVITDLTTETVLAESGRVSCHTPLAFTNVTAAHRYSADVQVYDVEADESANPFWSTSCGADGNGAALARSLQQVTIRGCDVLTGPGSAQTSISIDASRAVGALGCTDSGGVVFSIDVIPVEPEDSDLPTITQACGQDPLVYSGDEVEAGEKYTFRLDATDFALEQRWATTCTVTPREGFGLSASCGLLTDRGTITFPILALLDEAALSCDPTAEDGERVTRARIALVGPDDVDETFVDCTRDVEISAVKEGSYVGTIELFDESVVVATFSCTGTLDPATESTLVCSEDD